MTVNGKVENLVKDNDARIPCYFGFTTKKQWKGYIQDLLRKNDYAVKRGVVQIYKRQTFDEQLEQESNEINGIGFSKNDAPFLSTVAIAFINGKEVDAKTFEITRNKMIHYWKQLMEISKEGLDEKLKAIKLRLIEEDLNKMEDKDDVGNNTDNECNNNSSASCDSGENLEDYLFPELFGKAQEDSSADNPFDCRCSDNDCSNTSQS